MICGSNHQDAVIIFKSVHFVEEVASIAGTNDCVDVFQDEEARRHLAGLHEDGPDVESVVHGFDVEGWDGDFASGEGVHEGPQ